MESRSVNLSYVAIASDLRFVGLGERSFERPDGSFSAEAFQRLELPSDSSGECERPRVSDLPDRVGLEFNYRSGSLSLSGGVTTDQSRSRSREAGSGVDGCREFSLSR